MEELFNAVLKNPFLLLLLVGGVISLFRRKKGTSEQQEQQEQRSERSPTRTKPTVDPFGRNPTSQGRTVDQQVGETISTLSIEDQRKEELKSLREKMVSKEHQALENRPKVADARIEKETEDLTTSNAQKEFKRKFKSNLTQEGLVESIVMAEVLGHPRARQPYQSIITKRKR